MQKADLCVLLGGGSREWRLNFAFFPDPVLLHIRSAWSSHTQPQALFAFLDVSSLAFEPVPLLKLASVFTVSEENRPKKEYALSLQQL